MPEVVRTKYCIIGGGVAGVTAAERIRELDKEGSICIVGSESELLYSRVLLPDYVSGKITRDKCILRTQASFDELRIQLRLGIEISSIRLSHHTITTNAGEVIVYEQLLIATGGRPRGWTVPGADVLPVMRLQTIADADTMRTFALDHPGAHVAVVGGGFISMEAMEALVLTGIKTSLLVRESRMFEAMIPPGAHALLARVLREEGVQLETTFAVQSITVEEGVPVVLSEDGRHVPVDALVVGVGIERNLSLAVTSAIPTNRGIVVSEQLASTVPNVFAAGDIAEYTDLTFSRPLLLGNWTSSVLMGRVAGENMTGGSAIYQHIPLYAVECFGVKIQLIGIPSTTEGIENIEQYDAENRTYLSLSLENGMLIGAVTMNRTRDLGILTRWIKERKHLADAAEQLRGGAKLTDMTL